MRRRCLAAVVLAWAAVSTGAFAASLPVLCDEGFVCPANNPSLSLIFTTGSLPSQVAFSRGSNATQYNAAGQVAYAPANLVTQSGTFTNVSWGTITGTVTVAQGQADPDGGTSAVKLTSTTAGDQWGQPGGGGALIVGAQYVWSAWIRSDSPVSVQVGAYDGVTVNTHTFAVTTSWARYSFPFTASGASDRFQLFANPTLGTVAYFAKAQLEPSLQGTALAYNATGASAYFGPRFDYDPVALTPKGLLIEEARTNLALQSNTFSNASWGSCCGNSITAASGTSPDGSNDAWSLNEGTGATTSHQFEQGIAVTSGATASASAYFKQGTGRYVILGITPENTNGAYAVLDTQTGTITQSGAAGTGTFVSASVQPVGNGWYRLQVAGSITGSASYRLSISQSNSATPGAIVPSYTGTSLAILIYQADLNQASFSLSPIPTTTAAVTRSADVATVALAGIVPANPVGLTVIGKFRTAPGNGSANEWVANISDGSANNRLGFFRTTTGTISGFTEAAGVIGLSTTLWNAAPNNTDVALWLGLDGSSASAQAIGQTKTSGAAAMPTGLATLRLGTSQTGADSWLNSTIAKLLIYNRRLPDAQAAAIAAGM